jgi:hypothetical protein
VTTNLHYATVQRLRAVLGALAPIDNVSVPNGTFGDSAQVVITFNVSATQPQKDAANAALVAFDWSDAAEATWEAQQDPDKTALFAAAANAVSNNVTFLGLATPTNAQAVAQVQALTQQMNQVIRYLAEL